MSSFSEPKEKMNKLVTKLCLAVVVLAVCYFGFYKYQQSKIKFQPVGFSVEVNSKDLIAGGTKWLESYLEQYKGRYVPWGQKVAEYSIDQIENREADVIQIDFSVVTKNLNAANASKWNGVIEVNKIKCQWVLWFNVEPSEEGTYIYTVTKVQRPAGYDLEKYPKIDGAETNFYRTEDGGKSFAPVIIPAVKESWMGTTLEPFIHPETPYVEEGQLFLLVGQGPQGDYMGGTVSAKYKSDDMGKTWYL
ncbi:hypothetical protein DP73_19325 [Desulfosporosinus sp. HMP52]|uniref:hypothetical protein n=1 Tax=Desulfosporosinus sp. HMP52 TaxID=1487923 RepID=UPI00051FB01B|nr:hypothetical protein [Desulfosporosinus sp. HMP52]KGK83911.1 hypothetical protein DP73_19325 [Desulfosporosinus sp. HMP52]